MKRTIKSRSPDVSKINNAKKQHSLNVERNESKTQADKLEKANKKPEKKILNNMVRISSYLFQPEYKNRL
jgi:hypothetical protein